MDSSKGTQGSETFSFVRLPTVSLRLFARLSRAEILTYLALLARCDGWQGARPPLTTARHLAQATKLHPRNVQMALRRLESLGLFKRRGPARSRGGSRFELTDPAKLATSIATIDENADHGFQRSMYIDRRDRCERMDTFVHGPDHLPDLHPSIPVHPKGPKKRRRAKSPEEGRMEGLVKKAQGLFGAEWDQAYVRRIIKRLLLPELEPTNAEILGFLRHRRGLPNVQRAMYPPGVAGNAEAFRGWLARRRSKRGDGATQAQPAEPKESLKDFLEGLSDEERAKVAALGLG